MHRLCGDADAADDAVVSVVGLDGVNAACRLRLRPPGAAPGTATVALGLALAARAAAAHSAIGYFGWPARRTPADAGCGPPGAAAIDQAEKWTPTSRDAIFETHLEPVGDAADGRRPEPHADRLAGNLVSLHADRKARRAGGARRRCCRRPDPDRGRGAARRRRRRRAALLQFRLRRSTPTARSSAPSTRSISCRSANTCRSRTCSRARPRPVDAMPGGFRPAGAAVLVAAGGLHGLAADLLRDHLSRTRSPPTAPSAGFILNSPMMPGSAIRPAPTSISARRGARRRGPAAGARRQHRHLGHCRSARAHRRCLPLGVQGVVDARSVRSPSDAMRHDSLIGSSDLGVTWLFGSC